MTQERRRSRQMKAVMAGNLIRNKLGAIDTRESVEHVRIAALGSLAETRGLWMFLIEKGLATEEDREDYLDKGYNTILAQIEGHASEIYVVDAQGHG